MASETTVVAGLSEIQKILDLLPANIEKNVMRVGLRAGIKEFQEAAKANVPVDDGDLRDSLRVSTRSRRGEVTATLKAGGGKAFYAHMVEYGTAKHFIEPSVKKALAFDGVVRGKISHPGAAPKPFMRPALDENQEKAVKAMADYLRGRIYKELTKMMKR